MGFMKTGTPVPFNKVEVCQSCGRVLNKEGVCENCESTRL